MAPNNEAEPQVMKPKEEPGPHGQTNSQITTTPIHPPTPKPTPAGDPQAPGGAVL